MVPIVQFGEPVNVLNAFLINCYQTICVSAQIQVFTIITEQAYVG